MDAPPIQYARTPDGVNIAYCVSGSGRNFVHLPLALNHIQLSWTGVSFVPPWLQALAARFQLVQYDRRNQGMSSRGLPPELLGIEAGFTDFQTVMDALQLSHAVLFAPFGGAYHAARYASQHPERVTAIIAIAVSGRLRGTALALDLARQDWDLFLSTAAGGGADITAAGRKLLVEELKQTVTQEDWLNGSEALQRSIPAGEQQPRSQTPLVLSTLRTPTLVIYPRDLAMARLEDSQAFAAAIPGAKLVLVDGATIIGEIDQTLKAIDDFLAALPETVEHAPPSSHPAGLSAREIEVLRLVAAGRRNQQIADELVISLFTVNRHVSNIYAKTGAANRAEATAYAARQGLI